MKLVAFSHSSCSFFQAENSHGRFLVGTPQSGEPVVMPVAMGTSHSNAVESALPRDTGRGEATVL